MNGSNHHIQSSSLPRLPSFQQLNETIRNPEIAQVPPLQQSQSQSQQNLQNHQLSNHRFQYTNNDYKTLMQYNNPNYTQNGVNNTNSTNNISMEYSYGPSLHGRHESYPNQYTYPNPDVLKQPLTNRNSLTYMDRNKAYSYGHEFANQLNNGKICNTIGEYKFVNDLIQFLMRFEIKCNELKRCGPNGASELNDIGVNNEVSNLTENFMSALPVEDLDEALSNIKRIAQIFETIKVHNEHTKTNGLKRSGLFVYENGIKKQHIEKKKHIRKRQSKNGNINGSLIAGGELVPMDVHISQNGSTTSTTNGNGTHTNKNGNSNNNSNSNSNGNGNGNGNGIDHHEIASGEHNVSMKRFSSTGELNPQMTLKPEITCQHCCSQETPEWRRGPEGSRTLCNACGLFYSKLIKKYGLREADKVMLQRKQTGTVNDRRIF